MARNPHTTLLPVLAAALVASAWLGACGSDGRKPLTQGGPVDTWLGKDASSPSTACLTPQDGCPCDQDGQVVDCGKVVSMFGDYATCSVGSRTCTAGKWGACVGERQTTNTNGASTAGSGALSIMSLGTAGACPAGFDPCDPFCHRIVDSPRNIDAGSTFYAGDSGLTEVPSSLQGCNTLTITASSPTATVTTISPVTASPITLTAALDPPTCFASPFATTWTIDRFDYASITGNKSNNGSLSVLKPIVGDVVVTAYAAGLSASTTIQIKVNALEVPLVDGTNKASIPAQQTAFGTAAAPCAGTPASTATWLYPYANTYFPLGLPAPVPQYLYSPANATNPGAVKVTLRYPAGSTFTTADFNYSLVVQESNVVSVLGGVAANNLDPQVIIPQVAWSAFEQTSRGKNADILIQRLPCASGTCGCPEVEQEKPLTIHFVDGQLKGTIYYNSYSSPQGGGTGAILAITPGATSPILAVQPPTAGNINNKCTVCHSINQDGTRLISNTLSGPSIGNYDQSRQWNMTTAGPAPTVVNTYGATLPGDRFTFGGPRTDGLLYMSHAGNSGSDANWHSPNEVSGLFSVITPTTAIPVTGWPTDVLAVTPRFSPDGTKLAFGFWGGTALPQSPTGTTLPPVGAGTRLAVMDFTCASPPCTSSTTANYFTVSNARDVTPGSTERVAYPSFTPAGDAVVYQRQYRTSLSKGNTATIQIGSGPAVKITGTPTSNAAGLIKITPGGTRGTAKFDWSYGAASGTGVTTAATVALGTTGLTANFPSGTYVANTTSEWTWADFNGVLTSGWSPSHFNTIGGSMAELWMSNVPADKSTAATPTRLLALNGLDGTGASYLPQDARTISPPAIAYHHDGNSYTITQADNCGNTGTATASDYRLNYLPSVNPSEVGGLVWVVFTSRRMYGNVATDDPWDAEPGGPSCFSGIPPSKKLWIAAIDKSFTPGSDPSHPAFYLPGQELKAGNSNGYWVSAACIPVASATLCQTSDDCCGGSGASPTARCNAATSTCTAITACKAIAATCTSGSDCCNGLVCGGTGKCVNPVFYGTKQTYEREYVADCPAPKGIVWRFFEWQATMPVGTKIDLGVQTRALATDPYSPVTPISMGTITASTAPGAWAHGASTVGDLLKTNSVPNSLPRLLVTMTFKPNAAGTAAPNLKNWRLFYDCVDTQ